MFRTVLRIDGMVCSMCEAHINDAIRKTLNVRKVKSSHSKGTVEIISDEVLSEEVISNAIRDTSYRLISFECSEISKKHFLFR